MTRNDKELWAVLICGRVERVFEKYDEAWSYLLNRVGQNWQYCDCGVVRHYE